jgi:hypothetical protein
MSILTSYADHRAACADDRAHDTTKTARADVVRAGGTIAVLTLVAIAAVAVKAVIWLPRLSALNY